MGLDPDKFWRYTWKEVILLGESWHINHNLEWERLRYLVTNLYASQGAKRVKPTMFFKLPQDKFLKENVKPSTRSDFEAMKEKIKRAEEVGFVKVSDQFKDPKEIKPKK